MIIKNTFIGAAILVLAQTSWAQEASFHNAELRLAALPSMQSYSLAGTGLNVSNGLTSGDGISGGVTWFFQDLAVSADYKTLNTKMTAPAGIVTASGVQNVTTKLDHFVLNFEFLKKQEGEEKSFKESSPKGLTYLLGFEYRGRKADTTTPNVFMPSSNTYGVRLGLGYSKSLDEHFFFTSALGWFVPLYFDETSKKTGYYRISANPDAALDLVYKVNSFIDFSLGVHAIYERIYYSDTGARGVANATEITTNVYAPVELRFQF